MILVFQRRIDCEMSQVPQAFIYMPYREFLFGRWLRPPPPKKKFSVVSLIGAGPGRWWVITSKQGYWTSTTGAGVQNQFFSPLKYVLSHRTSARGQFLHTKNPFQIRDHGRGDHKVRDRQPPLFPAPGTSLTSAGHYFLPRNDTSRDCPTELS